MTNHCSVLGVRRTATPPEVKAAYRAKAREAHPDRGGSAERFAAIQRAYDVLSDDKQRAEWETAYQAWAAERGATPCPCCFAAVRTRDGGRNICPRCGSEVAAPVPSRFDKLRDDLIDRSADFLIHVGDRVGQEIASAAEQAVSRGLAALHTRLGRKR